MFSTQFSMSQASLLRALGPQKKKVEDVDLPGAMKTGGPARKQDFGYLLVFVIQVSNRRFVSVAQIQKCAPFVYVCVRASARCLQVSLKLRSVQLALHTHGTMLFCITTSAGSPARSCYVVWPLVPRRAINWKRALCTAGSQAGFEWGMCYRATQASRWGVMRLSASQFVPPTTQVASAVVLEHG